MKLYRIYSTWLKEHYGEKVYKLPINIPVTCPNRDGCLGQGGCIYCGGKGGGNETLSDTLSVTKQLEQNAPYIAKRYKAKKFIPFFQSFTNTYLPLECFKQYIQEAGSYEGVVGIAIATRPDCIFEETLSFLKTYQDETGIDISIELGLQTANNQTLKKINRGHDVADYIEAAMMVKQYGLQLCTHVILDLPWDVEEDVIASSKTIAAVQSDFVKCHALYIEKNTCLERLYKQQKIMLFNQDEYIKRCILFLSYLSPNVVVQRIIGRAPESDSVVTNWNTSWWKVKENLETEMKAKKRQQGDNFHKNQKKIRAKLSNIG